jgi:phospholipid-binding lipoprotein MlaA
MAGLTTPTAVARIAETGLGLGLALVAYLGLAGCATPPTNPEARAAFEEANDPLEPLNRKTFAVNLFLDHSLIRPAARVYREVPPPLRSSLHNVFETLRSPALFADEVAQGDFKAAFDTAFRLVFNLAFGFGGMFDPADDLAHVKAHDTDFGVTLAKWGFSDGPYIVLPIFGPSNPRDAVGLAADSMMDPLGFYIPWYGSVARAAAEGVDKREPLIEPLDEMERTSVDFYAALRSLYRQHRQAMIRGGHAGANVLVPTISPDDLTDPGGGPAQPGAPAKGGAAPPGSTSQ